MFDRALIQAILDKHNIPLSSEPVRHGENPNHLYMFISIERDRKNHQIPSNTKLKSASEDFYKNGLTVDFMLVEAALQDVEAGLRATLLHKFGSDLRNIFLSVRGKNAHVWLDTKRKYSESTQKEIYDRTTAYLSQLELQLASLSSLSGENLPGLYAILQSIRLLAPVGTSELSEFLSVRKFAIPSIDWLNRRLDALRKAGRIVRLRTGQYALALSSIRELGTKRGRESPDIARLLALARKRS